MQNKYSPTLLAFNLLLLDGVAKVSRSSRLEQDFWPNYTGFSVLERREEE